MYIICNIIFSSINLIAQLITVGVRVTKPNLIIFYLEDLSGSGDNKCWLKTIADESNRASNPEKVSGRKQC